MFDTSYRMLGIERGRPRLELMFTYVSIGWWATMICATLVLAVWRGHDALEARVTTR